MKIIIDIGHPAHVHYFKHLANYFIENKHKVLFVTRKKDTAIELLNYYGFHYINIGKTYKSLIGKIWGLFYFTLRFLIISISFKPDIFLNATFYSAVVAFLFRKPHISIEDTFNKESVVLFRPFTSVILTGDFEHPSLGRKEIKYSGYQELLYLHPNSFKANAETNAQLGIGPNEKYTLIRFVSWNASHDKGYSGITLEQKIELVKALNSKSKVFISSEGPLPGELQTYALKIHPAEIHNVMASASLFIGEGATMASECVMLGTPAIYVNPLDVFTIREQQIKYNLVFSYRNLNGVIEKANDILDNYSKEDFISRRDSMLKDKIDVNAFLIWFVGKYPKSAQIMRENPDYQLRFK